MSLCSAVQKIVGPEFAVVESHGGLEISRVDYAAHPYRCAVFVREKESPREVATRLLKYLKRAPINWKLSKVSEIAREEYGETAGCFLYGENEAGLLIDHKSNAQWRVANGRILATDAETLAAEFAKECRRRFRETA